MTETVSTRSKGAAKGKGLTLERVFSTEGVHPYDAITWERRDVVQQNWKTGETVFEQHGVEYPEVVERVNASTIVTTKYFRGARRHRQPVRPSLKQLIDRVVLTSTSRPAVEHGYFASEKDAEIFEHELTWHAGPPVLQPSTPRVVQRRHAEPAAGLRLLHPLGRRLDGLDPQLVQGGGLHLQGRLRRRPEPLADPLLQGATCPRAAPPAAPSPSCAVPTPPQAPSSPVAPRAAQPRWSSSTSTTPTSSSSSRPRPARRTRSARCATPGSTWTSAGKRHRLRAVPERQQLRARQRRVHARRRGRHLASACGPAHRRRGHRDRRRPSSCSRKIAQAAWECADPGMQYDDTINDWHTNPETGRITASNPCSEYMSASTTPRATSPRSTS